jgi:hypothetical protein
MANAAHLVILPYVDASLAVGRRGITSVNSLSIKLYTSFRNAVGGFVISLKSITSGTFPKASTAQ